MALLRASATWQDGTGTGELATSWYQGDEATGIYLAIAQASSCTPHGLWATTLVQGPGNTLPGSVPAQVCARLLYATSNGLRVPLLIPGAQAGVYMSDGETVDPNSSLVQAISAAYIADGMSAAGETIVEYVSGTKLIVRLPGITH